MSILVDQLPPGNNGARSRIPSLSSSCELCSCACSCSPPCNGVAYLPVEILEYIFALISPYKDLDSCALTCRHWRDTVRRIREKKLWAFPFGLTKERLRWHVLAKEEGSVLRNANDTSKIITPRYGHASHVVDDDLFIYGGLSSVSTGFNDLWRLNLTDRRWKRITTTGCHPLPKGGATLVRRENTLYLLGGSLYGMSRDGRVDAGLGGPFTCQGPELHALDLTDFSWRQLASSNSASRHQTLLNSPSGASPLAIRHLDETVPSRLCASPSEAGSIPPATSFHSATVHGNEMVVFGGQSMPGHSAVGPRIVHGEVWCFDLDKETWRKPVFEHSCVASRRRPLGLRSWPEPRWMQSQIKLDETHLLIIGGFGGPNAPFRDIWLLEIGTERTNWKWNWKRVAIENQSPTGVWSRPFIKVGSYLVVLGPCDDCGRTNARFYVDRAVTMSVVMGVPRAPRSRQPQVGDGAGERRHSAGDASPSVAVPEERYVNGRYGELRRNSTSSSASQGVAVPASSACNGASPPSSSPPKRCSPSSLRPSAAKNAQIRLENLRKHEERMVMLGRMRSPSAPPPLLQPARGTLRRLSASGTGSSPAAVLHLLDISRVISDNVASWVQNDHHSRCSPGPPDSPVYSFHCGKMSEFIVFGGLVTNGDRLEPTNDVYFGSLPPDFAP